MLTALAAARAFAAAATTRKRRQFKSAPPEGPGARACGRQKGLYCVRACPAAGVRLWSASGWIKMLPRARIHAARRQRESVSMPGDARQRAARRARTPKPNNEPPPRGMRATPSTHQPRRARRAGPLAIDRAGRDPGPRAAANAHREPRAHDARACVGLPAWAACGGVSPPSSRGSFDEDGTAPSNPHLAP
ncbi:hypothetical protein B0H17DRAFT_1339617 [Mycena rosella]|uniref:Uncharacterized protein n=1 Tax=Mycena rosella TaxID=1033263 RepID=A0AAD7C0N6_MYCRO|nr:hypothetical protein B0H17DRAFT_1339617 [Mycena rosella]